jgi:hypothetical protein
MTLVCHCGDKWCLSNCYCNGGRRVCQTNVLI